MTEAALLDLGYSNGKIGTLTGKLEVIPAVISSGYDLTGQFEFTRKAKKKSIDVLTDNGHYFIGDLAKEQGSIFFNSIAQNRYDDPAFDAYAKAMLGYLFPSDDKIRIMTGLPPKFYASHKHSLEKALKGTHEFVFRGQNRLLEVSHVKIIPQLVGTAVDLLYNDDLSKSDSPLHIETVGIIDPGFGTTDIAIVQKGVYKFETVDSLRYNMYSVAKLVKDTLFNQYGIEIKDIFDVDDIVRTKVLVYQSKPLDVSHVVDWAKKTIAMAIVSEVNNRWLSDWKLNRIIVTGGGGESLYEFIKEAYTIPVDLIPKAQLANLRGYGKMARKEWG